MPHLAPMSWIQIIIMIMLIVSLMNTMSWWTNPTKFLYFKKTDKSVKKSSWLW